MKGRQQSDDGTEPPLHDRRSGATCTLPLGKMQMSLSRSKKKLTTD